MRARKVARVSAFFAGNYGLGLEKKNRSTLKLARAQIPTQ
jgi:hypothetical protein